MPSESVIAVARSTLELTPQADAPLLIGTAAGQIVPAESCWRPKPHFYLTVLTLWMVAVAWFHPQLATLPALGKTVWAKGALWFFVLFINIAWGYAAYNISVILFGAR